MVDQKELIEDFTNESSELLELLEGSIMDLEKKRTDPELVNSIFRYVHTIKGTSSFLGLSTMAHAAHQVETVLDRVRKRIITPDREIIDLILQFVDHARSFLQLLLKNKHAQHDFSDLINTAKAVLEERSAAGRQSAATPAPVTPENDSASAAALDVATLLDAAPTVKPRLDLPWEKPDAPDADGAVSEHAEKVDAHVEKSESGSESNRGDNTDDEPDFLPPKKKNEPFKIWINPEHEVKANPMPAHKRSTGTGESADRDNNDTRVLDREFTRDTQEVPRSNSDDSTRTPDTSSKTRVLTVKKEHTTGDSGNESGDDKKTEVLRRSASRSGKTTFVARSTIRVDLKRIDEIVNQIVELVSEQHRLQELVDRRNRDRQRLIETELPFLVESLSAATFELHKAIRKVRLVPLSSLFNRFPRLIRDLQHIEGKGLRLDTIGEDTELDKTIVEAIADPLVHLIRNAAAHGIESKEEREAANKPRTGTISLSARTEGDQVTVSVEDDGRGIDIEKISQKALRLGLIDESRLSRMSRDDILDFIFLPGFSTQDEASGLAGRGVGMDVVRGNVTDVGGTVQINTELGKGTTITLRLPLTLAIVQALKVLVDDMILAIPLYAIKDVSFVEADKLEVVRNRRFYKSEYGVVPVMDLAQALGYRDDDIDRDYVVVVIGSEKLFGLFIDEPISQDSIVVKKLSPLLGPTPGISGATIMGDGVARLIVDVNRLTPATW